MNPRPFHPHSWAVCHDSPGFLPSRHVYPSSPFSLARLASASLASFRFCISFSLSIFPLSSRQARVDPQCAPSSLSSRRFPPGPLGFCGVFVAAVASLDKSAVLQKRADSAREREEIRAVERTPPREQRDDNTQSRIDSPWSRYFFPFLPHDGGAGTFAILKFYSFATHKRTTLGNPTSSLSAYLSLSTALSLHIVSWLRLCLPFSTSLLSLSLFPFRLLSFPHRVTLSTSRTRFSSYLRVMHFLSAEPAWRRAARSLERTGNERTPC